MAESYSVTAILSARDKNFGSVFGSAQGSADSLAGKLKSGLGFGVLAGIGMKAASAVTGALGSMVSGVVETGKSFETATSQIAATMGTSKSEIQDIIAKAENLGATTKFTATEAAEGFNILAMSGLTAEQQIASIGDVLSLAAAGAESMDAAAQQVVGTMKGFSMEIEGVTKGVDNSRYVADLLAKGATLAATDVNDLGTALSIVSSNAAQYGQGIESTEVALLRLAEQNQTGSEAATALSMAMKDIYAPTDQAAEVMEKLGVNAYDPTTHKARDFNEVVDELNAALHKHYGTNEELINQDINQIFDARSARVFGKMIVSDTNKVNEFSEALSNASEGAGSAAKQAAEQLDNLEGDMTLFSSATDGLNNAIYKNMNVPMRAFYKVATAGISGATGLVQKFGDKLSTGIDLKTLQTAIDEKGLAGGISVIAESVGDLVPGLKQAGAAAGALAGISMVSGFLDSGVWKAGVAGVGTFKDVMGMLPGAMKKDAGAITGKIAEIGNGLMNVASKTVPNLLTNMDKAGDAAKKAGDKVSGMFGKAKEATAGKFAKAFPNLTAAMRTSTKEAGKAASGILGVFGKMGSGLTKVMGVALKAVMPAAIIGAALAGLGVLYSQFGTQIDQILGLVAQKGPEVITNFVSGITSRLPALIASGAQLVSGVLGAITANLPALIQGGVSLIQSLVMGVSTSASMLMTKGIELIGTFVVGIASAIPQLITTGMTLLASLAQGAANNLPLLASYAMNAVMTFAQGIISNLPQILASAVSIVSSLSIGITNMLPVLISQGIQLISYLAQSFIQNLPMIIKTGVTVIASLVSGLIQAVPMIVQGAVELVKSLIDTIIHTDWIKVGGDVISAIGDGIKSGFTGVGDLISGLFSGDTSAAEGAAQQATVAAESTAQAYIDSSSYVSAAASQVGIEAQESLASGFESIDISGLMESIGTDGVSTLTEAMSAIDLTGIGTEASGTVTSEFDAGMSELPGITTNAGTQVVSSLKQTGTQATTIAKQTMTKVIATLKAGINPAKSAGKSAGSGYAGGIRGESANASSAGSAIKNAALSGMSGGYGSAYSHGSNIGQGLVDGMRSKIGAAWAAANELAAAADKAIHARAQIGSPSKITIQYGQWIAEGLAVGIKSGANGVVKQAKNLVDTLYKQMKKSTKKLGSVKDASSTYLKAFKTGLQEKAKSDLEYVENSLKKYRDVSKSYNSTITALMKSYKTAYNKEVDKLISSVSTKLSTLANTYQTKYNNIVNAQKDFRDTLQSTSLYTADEYGNIALTSFATQNRAIKQYQTNINKLKKLLPESMMDEILGMSRENGLAYTNELLKKSSDWIKAYGKQYSVMMNTGSKVASTYYSGRVTALQKSYAEDLKKIYNNAQKDMGNIGKNVVQGLIDGMKSKKGALDSTGKTLAQVVEDAFKRQLKIKSPSRVMTDAGEDTGQGVIDGIENKVRAARAAMTKLIEATSPEVAISRRSGDMSLNDEYDYKTEAHYNIVVESILDGKKVGEGTAKFVKRKNDAEEKRERRKRGKT